MLACCSLSLVHSLAPRTREDAILCKEQYFCNLCATEASGIAAKCNQMERKSTLLSRARRSGEMQRARSSEPKKRRTTTKTSSWQCSKSEATKRQILEFKLSNQKLDVEGEAKRKIFSLCSNYGKFLVMLRKVARSLCLRRRSTMSEW